MLGSVLSGSWTDRTRERGEKQRGSEGGRARAVGCQKQSDQSRLLCLPQKAPPPPLPSIARRRERRRPRSGSVAAVAFAADGLKGKGADEDGSGKQTWSSVLYKNAHLTFSFPFPPSLQVLTLIHDISSFQSYEIAPNSGDGSWSEGEGCLP